MQSTFKVLKYIYHVVLQYIDAIVMSSLTAGPAETVKSRTRDANQWQHQ